MLKSFAFVSVTCAILLSAADNAKAEYCDMQGCKGQIGYIFIPTLVFGKKGPTDFILMGGGKSISCNAIDDNPFGGTNLPLVNSDQVIQKTLGLFDEAEIQTHLDEFRSDHAEESRSDRSCHVVWSEPESSLTLRGGEVRILGYRTFAKHRVAKGAAGRTLEQILFAMVLIKKD